MHSRIVKHVALSQVCTTFKGCDGMPKLLLRFTDWPSNNLLSLIQNFMVFMFCPSQCLSLHGILLYVVTSTLLSIAKGYRAAYFSSQPACSDRFIVNLFVKTWSSRVALVYCREGHVSGELLERLLQKLLIYRVQSRFQTY